MLRRRYNARRGEFEFATRKVARVVGDQMFHATGNGQFQNVVIIRVRQIRPPTEENRLPGRRRAEIVEQGFALEYRHGHIPPQAFPTHNFLVFGKQGFTHEGLVIPCQTAIQHFRARAFLTAQGGDKNIGILDNFHAI